MQRYEQKAQMAKKRKNSSMMHKICADRELQIKIANVMGVSYLRVKAWAKANKELKFANKEITKIIEP